MKGRGEKPDVNVHMPFAKAKKLLEAVGKSKFDRLTAAQAEAVAEFHEELMMKVMEAE